MFIDCSRRLILWSQTSCWFIMCWSQTKLKPLNEAEAAERYVESCAYFLAKVGEIMMLNPLEVFNVLDPLSARVSFPQNRGWWWCWWCWWWWWWWWWWWCHVWLYGRYGLFCQGLVRPASKNPIVTDRLLYTWNEFYAFRSSTAAVSCCRSRSLRFHELLRFVVCQGVACLATDLPRRTKYFVWVLLQRRQRLWRGALYLSVSASYWQEWARSRLVP